jgi:prophage regulatory protein
MTEKRLERLDSVKRRTGLCTSEIYKFMREGTFPLNFPLSKQSVAWDAADIDDWIDAKLAGSRFPGRGKYPAKKAAKIAAEKVA